MKLIIDSEVIEKHGLSVPEFMLLALVVNRVNTDVARNALVSKGFILNTLAFEESFGYARTKFGVETYNAIVLESTPVPSVTQERLLNLAKQLKEIYPKGKKDQTWYWADSAQIISKRLEAFFFKYDKLGKVTDEQIINATKKYVDEMLGKPDMRLLKYFIWKEPVGKGGTVEPTSDLLTYIENADQVDENNPNNFLTIF